MTNEESMALFRVQSAVSDYLLGLDNSGFAEFCGGVDALLNTLKVVNQEWEDKFNTLEGDE